MTCPHFKSNRQNQSTNMFSNDVCVDLKKKANANTTTMMIEEEKSEEEKEKNVDLRARF